MQSYYTGSRPRRVSLFRPAKLSEVFGHAETPPRKTKTVLAIRVSGKEQDRSGSMERQRRNLLRVAKKHGWKIMDEHAAVESGWRPWLYPAIQKALKHKAVIVAESADRIIRAGKFHSSKRPDAVPSNWEAAKLKKLPVKIYTLLHPDTPPWKVRSYQRKRGQREKGKRGGRPLGTKAFRKRWLPYARKLRERGRTYRAIAERVTRKAGQPISYGSIRRWLFIP